jgi:hypothetical protein
MVHGTSRCGKLRLFGLGFEGGRRRAKLTWHVVTVARDEFCINAVKLTGTDISISIRLD